MKLVLSWMLQRGSEVDAISQSAQGWVTDLGDICPFQYAIFRFKGLRLGA